MSIDLYDTPIDLRPAPKVLVTDAIEYLRQCGDYYGVILLTERMKYEAAKDIENTECPREEES